MKQFTLSYDFQRKRLRVFCLKQTAAVVVTQALYVWDTAAVVVTQAVYVWDIRVRDGV